MSGTPFKRRDVLKTAGAGVAGSVVLGYGATTATAGTADEDTTADVTFPIEIDEEIRAMTVGDEYLYAIVEDPRRVVRIDPGTESITETYDTDELGSGITYDGSDIWLVDFGTSMAYRLDIETGSLESEFSTPGDPTGIVYDGEAFWIANIFANNLHRMDSSGSELDRFGYGSQTTSSVELAYHDDELWVGDSDGDLFTFETDGDLVESDEAPDYNDMRQLVSSEWGVLVTTDEDEIVRFEEDIDDQPSIEDYADEDTGRIETDGLIDAFSDWQAGTIDSDLIIDVFLAWQSGETVT